MPKSHQCPVFEYRRSPDQDAGEPVRHPVVVVGAGPIGLSAAIDLAQRGIEVVLLEAENGVSDGSRAICFAKRTLEIFDRLGGAQPMVDKGITWKLGRVFFGDREVYRFDLLPEEGHRRPAFINLQQYYLEEYLIEHLQGLERADLRWCNEVVSVAERDDGVHLTVRTPEGEYPLIADYLIVADGAKSPLRKMLGLSSEGQVFKDRFLIADVVMDADFPTERWFWFDPPFHPGQSVLLHRQADNVFRIDFQLGWEADPEAERQPERVIPRIQAMLGEDVDFDLDWVSVYTFQCRRMPTFHPSSRIFFAGDAAHQVSPFGARGANSGVQDVDNLIWKLERVMQGRAGDRLLETYDSERIAAADENILNSTRSTDFITPKSEVSRSFRDATLMLAEDFPFARRLVNSGRLSVPTVLSHSVLNTPDQEPFEGAMVPGAPCADAPVRIGGRDDWLLAQLGGDFTVLAFADEDGGCSAGLTETLEQAREREPGLRIIVVGRSGGNVPEGAMLVGDSEGLAASRYDGRAGTVYVIRPDQHVVGRRRGPSAEVIGRIVDRACARAA
ncbi:FAD-dependent oxidoreductase [Arhodomonas sp. SL1]|uniref:FAD-dependent oxidoreductase n=1 Tax=Arhodomonas sp. SL1 TaxID=3425691 RepID=UPI003F88204A